MEPKPRQAELAAALRGSVLIAEILRALRRDVPGTDMIRATLSMLTRSFAAQGTAVADAAPGLASATLLHRDGEAADAVLPAIGRLLRDGFMRAGDTPRDILEQTLPDGRTLLVAGFLTAGDEHAALAMWRAAGARPWDHEERVALGAAAGLMRVLLCHAATRQAAAWQASLDPLTGLLNRRAFLGELPRRLERLDRDGLPGTLLFADLDHFKALNDQLGHDAGDRVLVAVADLLAKVFRPTDLLARLGGNSFAMWMSGADHMTAAERAEALRVAVPEQIVEAAGSTLPARGVLPAQGISPALGISIGIASRQAGGSETIETLVRRADLAMHEVKRTGRGHWRVAHGTDP